MGDVYIPKFDQTIFPRIAKIPSSIGEIRSCHWLFLVGIKTANNNMYEKQLLRALIKFLCILDEPIILKFNAILYFKFR
jgi:hypothetical protein